MTNKTIKLTLEGEPVHVEAIARLLRQAMEIKAEGKNQRLQLSPDKIRRVLHLAAPTTTHQEEL